LTPGELTDKNWEDAETSPVLSTLASLCNKVNSNLFFQKKYNLTEFLDNFLGYFMYT